MFIKYVTPQKPVDSQITEYKSNGGDYRPTWLLRTSDWEKVPGTEATSGYCTLSYCWEQSGKIVQRPDSEEYDCINEPGHRLSIGVEKRTLSNFFRKHETTKVTFDGILQQICKDFDIDYLWYDKVCINQMNKEEKHCEIKQMHLVYSNARFTVSLVPEIKIYDSKVFQSINWLTRDTAAKQLALDIMRQSLWWKRSWTLEELMMSTRMLLVGVNTHMWCLGVEAQGNSVKEHDILSNEMLGFKNSEFKSANVVLRHAHFRTSTKDQDKIFALANIFHGIVDVDVDYHSNVTDVMQTFYRRLLEQDLSILCFGSAIDSRGNSQFNTTMTSYGLPSWTGVAGLHSRYPVNGITVDRNGGYTIDDDMRLHIKCRGYTVRPIQYTDQNIYMDEKRGSKSNHKCTEAVTTMKDFDDNLEAAKDWGQWVVLLATACFATHYYVPEIPLCSPILSFSLTEDCDECIIIAVAFLGVKGVTNPSENGGYEIVRDHDIFLPVLKKSEDGSTYKVIGFTLLKHLSYHYESRLEPQTLLDETFNSLCQEPIEFVIE